MHSSIYLLSTSNKTRKSLNNYKLIQPFQLYYSIKKFIQIFKQLCFVKDIENHPRQVTAKHQTSVFLTEALDSASIIQLNHQLIGEFLNKSFYYESSFNLLFTLLLWCCFHQPSQTRCKNYYTEIILKSRLGPNHEEKG